MVLGLGIPGALAHTSEVRCRHRRLTFVMRPLSFTRTRSSEVAWSCTSHHPCSPSVPHAVFFGGMSCQSSWGQLGTQVTPAGGDRGKRWGRSC